jgi:hypothetical protein
MLVVLLNVKVDALVKVKGLAVTFISERLQLGNDSAPSGHNLLPAQENSV